MKGIVFNLFEEVVEQYGASTWDDRPQTAGVAGSYRPFGADSDCLPSIRVLDSASVHVH